MGDFKITVPTAFLSMAMGPSLAEAQDSRLFGSGARASVDHATGEWTWTLPLGVIPGDHSVPVTFRCAHAGDSPSGESKAGGLRFDLDVGRLVPGNSIAPGFQFLENGLRLSDKDWAPLAGETAAPAMFGFKSPKEGKGVLADSAGTRFFYPANLANLGPWASQAASLSGCEAFMVIQDPERARVFAFNDLFGCFVPVLWVDRGGHAITFRWGRVSAGSKDAFSLQMLNGRGKGLQVVWGSRVEATGEEDLLRADFIGIPLPSLLVKGRASNATALPAGFLGFPTKVRMGTPDSLARATFGKELPEAPACAPAPPREWDIAYGGSREGEVSSLMDPWGVTTTYRFGSYTLPGSLDAVRGVEESTSMDRMTGTTFRETWKREETDLGCWRVSHQAAFSDGLPTEGRTTIATFKKGGLGRPSLQSVQVAGTAGSASMTSFDEQKGAGPLNRESGRFSGPAPWVPRHAPGPGRTWIPA